MGIDDLGSVLLVVVAGLIVLRKIVTWHIRKETKILRRDIDYFRQHHQILLRAIATMDLQTQIDIRDRCIMIYEDDSGVDFPINRDESVE
jgi:hypothetical protein